MDLELDALPRIELEPSQHIHVFIGHPAPKLWVCVQSFTGVL